MRYIWDQFDQYFGKGRSSWLTETTMKFIRSWLQRWDVKTSRRVNNFIANSRHVQKRIKKYYGKEATVIHPPVDTELFTPASTEKKGDYFLTLSAFAPYKRLDLAVEAFNQLGIPFFVIGEGQDEKRLKEMAKPNIHFEDWLDISQIRSHFARCRGFVFCGEEDFGIAPVEALACGRPVIALSAGGARETVEDGVTGLLVKDDTVDGFTDAVNDMASFKYDPVTLHQAATRFSTAALPPTRDTFRSSVH